MAALSPPELAHQAGDLLADLATVLGDERVPVAAVPARLRDLAPGLPALPGPDRGEAARALGTRARIKVASTGNRYPVDPTKIRQRIAWRAADGPDEGSG